MTKEDAISRQDMLDEIERISVKAFETYEASTDLYTVVSMMMPSVTPVEKIGQWIFDDTAKEHAHCSECGYGNVDLVNGKPHNYCENCGAKMEMPENISNKMSRANAIRYCDEYLATNNVSNIDKEFLRAVKEALQQEPKESET